MTPVGVAHRNPLEFLYHHKDPGGWLSKHLDVVVGALQSLANGAE